MQIRLTQAPGTVTPAASSGVVPVKLMNELWPPYCGAERHASAQSRYVHVDDLVGVCTRNCHPVTELHVDIERGDSWSEPGHYLRSPFTPSSGS